MLKENQPLQADHMYPNTEMVTLESLTHLPSRKGLENAVLSNGQIVNVVSRSYGHLPNDLYYPEIERQLQASEISHRTRYTNRDNRSFKADYILNRDEYNVQAHTTKDPIYPMLSFKNSYDGSCQTTGHFGFFREVCKNGLHVSTSTKGFSIRHTVNGGKIVLPSIEKIIQVFMNNDYYTITSKFTEMQGQEIFNVKEWVEKICDQTKIFQFASSEKNPEPGLLARTVIDTIHREARMYDTGVNFWTGYNAFNEVLHTSMKKPFDKAEQIDANLFEHVYAMIN